MRLGTLCAALLAATALSGCQGSTPSSGGATGPWQPSLQATSWTHPYGVRIFPAQTSSGISFQFPVYTGPLPPAEKVPSLGYILTGAKGPLGAASIEVEIEILTTGTPVFQFQLEPSNTGTAPAAMRLLIQRSGDDLTQEFSRWWSTAGIELRSGVQSLVVSLEPVLWSSVFGKRGDQAPEQFAECLQNIERIGATFGGGLFYGHGVNVSGGTAEIVVRRYQINW